MKEEDFGVIKDMSEIENRLELLHMEFAVEKMPEYSEYNMRQIWSENRELRKKILLCQQEYISENEQKNKEKRKYIDLLRVSDQMKKQYEGRFKYLNEEINEARKELTELESKLRNANDFTKQLLGELSAKDDRND